VVVVVVVVVAASGGDDEADSVIGDIQRSPETPIVIPAGEPIIIAVSAPLSGPDETLGVDLLDAAVVGVELWKAENGDTIGGHAIELHAEDDGCSTAEIAGRAAGHLLQGEDDHRLLPGLVGVIGPACSQGAVAAMPAYAEEGIVMISGSATRTDLTLNQPEPKFFFRTAYTNANEGQLQARYIIARLDAATAYVIDDSELYGADLARSVQQALSGRQVTRESIERKAADFSELAGRIAADNPDVVIFAGFNPEAALLYRQLRDAGYTGPFISDDGVVSKSDFIAPLGGLSEGALFAGCSLTLPEEFLADYVKIIGHEPEIAFPAQVADAVTILLDALAQVAQEQPDGSLVINPLELRDAVSTPELLVGVSGAIAFDANGDRIGQGEDVGLAMCKVEDGEFVNFRF
jgi:branched-chain amino acid transport system substrate-binding protein